MIEEPPQKLRKIDDDLIKIVNVVPILDFKLSCDTVPSTPFQALRLEDKKIIGKIIGRLKELPEQFQHLKRVGKDGSVLIAECEEPAKNIISTLDHPDIKLDDLKTVLVPSIKPLTRRQFDFAKKLWPTGFHPNHEIEQALSGAFLTASFKEYISRWIQKTLELGGGCLSVQNGALLSSGSPSSHPLGHAVMEMVGNLPKRTGSDYLGTGSDVFLINEPCAMCSMALVHFRIKRLFYVRSTENGVLKEDGWQLHLEPLINHHYEVFRVQVSNNWDNNTFSSSVKSSLCTRSQ